MDIFQFLGDLGISYQKFEHPPVFTCEEAERLCPEMPGVHAKSLFLRDRKGERHFLVIIPYDKNTDLKALGGLLGVSKLSFASPERLKKHLGLEPGSVSYMGLINDSDHAVDVFFDTDLWKSEEIQSHPLVNTATLVLARSDIEKFLAATGHTFTLIDVPHR